MTLTLNLPAELERQLRARAVERGKDVETIARELLEQGVAASGVSDDGLTSSFEEEEEEKRWREIHSHTRHPLPPEAREG